MEEHANVLRSKVRKFLIWVLVVQIFIYCSVLYHETKNKINYFLGKKKRLITLVISRNLDFCHLHTFTTVSVLVLNL
jgi:hypothetical protein